MGECIFCLIAQGKIPSSKIYETDSLYAFLDLNPVHKGHTLIIPKKHAGNIFDLDPALGGELPEIVLDALKKCRFFALDCKWFCDDLEKSMEISASLYGFTAVLQFHTKILCNLCESCMIFSQKDLTNQKKCSIINTFHRKSEKILDERNKMQYNRGRCNFCNTIFESESRPICGLFGLKNRKEDLYEIKNNKRDCSSSGLLFGHGRSWMLRG